MTTAAASIREFTTSSATASSTTSGPNWAVTNVYDGNLNTAWSSNLHANANNTESLAYWWSEGMQLTNYVKLLPRYNGNKALCFPVAFTVSYSNGSEWKEIYSQPFTNYPTPNRGDWIIIPFPANYTANGVFIIAASLGIDDVGNYAFQMAEARAGYDSGFNRFVWAGNNLSALSTSNQIQGTGSGAFNPTKLSNWNYDDRGVVISPNGGPKTYRNIYAPQAVYQGGTSWNVYFGGWDGSTTWPPHDCIYLTTTSDNFVSFNAHATMIRNGKYNHANNPSVVKVSGSDWRMTYTVSNKLNKTCYSTSYDGENWNPNAANSSTLITVTGYPWSNADVNGGNVIFKDTNGLWHLYFIDFANFVGVLHATSTDFVNYSYQGVALNAPPIVVPQDLKAFTYGGTTYYFGVYHYNTQHIWTTLGTSLLSLGSPTQLICNLGSADMYITSAGLVQDGSRLYGILYGASPTSTCTPPPLDQNQIFASWLQKKVIFQNRYVRWGDIERGFGPDNVRLYLASGDSVETGTFLVYDTDGTTLLYSSPLVTIRAGDVWNYKGP